MSTTWRRPPYRPRRWLPILLFLLTFVSTTTLGAGWFLAMRTDMTWVPANDLGGFPWLGLATLRQVWGDPEIRRLGLAFSIPTLLIMLAHELGHYLACRRYGIPATWPHFLPVPIGLGTFGAFIRIKGRIRTKRQLFDIGVAGPIAGFVLMVPFLAWGVAHSVPRAVDFAEPGTTNWILYQPGRSLLLGLFERVFHGQLGADVVLDLHPFALAGWVGLLVTSLNLIPLGQLDGGHILYAVAGRRQRWIAPPLLVLLILAGYYYWPGWWLWCLLVIPTLRHPPVRDEAVALDGRRLAVAAFALLMMALCFMPVPLDGAWVQQ